MSTIIMISLAVAIIFWRPPFQVPRLSRKKITPIIMIIIISSLILIGTFKSSPDETCSNQTTKEVTSTNSTVKQSTFKF